MKLRSGTKVVIIAVAFIGSLYGLRELWAWSQTRTVYPALLPGRVNLVAMRPGGGYRIIVANEIAQLAEVPNQKFTGEREHDDSEGEVTNRKRIPIKELLESLQGNEKSLGTLVMKVNDFVDDRPGPSVPVFTAEEVQRAIKGDAPYRTKLEQALNVDLKGRPLPQLNLTALEYGIVVACPVKVRVNVGGKQQTLTATVFEQYLPRLLKSVQRRYADQNVSDNQKIGYYIEEARQIEKDPSMAEDVAANLSAILASSQLQQLATKPEQLLMDTKVLVTERQVRGARMEVGEGQDGKASFALHIDLTPEGRSRLWQYSRGRAGFQLLLIVDGIAIAAPRIYSELSGSTVVIDRLTDRRMAENAAKAITGS